MMRILFLSTWFPYPADNGSKIRVKYLLRALAEHHEVTLVSFAFATAQPALARELPFQSVHTIPLNPYIANQTSSLRSLLSPNPVIYRPLPAMKKLVAAVLAENQFAVVIASTELMATYALQAGPQTRKVIEEHNSLSQQMGARYKGKKAQGHKALRDWLAWQKTRRYERQLFKKFDLVTMVSQLDLETSAQLLGHASTTLALVPNGVDCAHNKPAASPKNPRLLVYNGALSYQANYQAMAYFLKRIYPLIRARIPDVHLLITGSTAGVDLARLPLDTSVTLSGYVDDIRPLVAGAAICVVPLLHGGGTRLKILEAMALGTPVISTTRGAAGLDAVPGQHLLIADTPQDFAKSVVSLLLDPAMQTQLQHNARQFVAQHYDWRDIGARFVSLVEGTLN